MLIALLYKCIPSFYILIQYCIVQQQRDKHIQNAWRAAILLGIFFVLIKGPAFKIQHHRLNIDLGRFRAWFCVSYHTLWRFPEDNLQHSATIDSPHSPSWVSVRRQDVHIQVQAALQFIRDEMFWPLERKWESEAKWYWNYQSVIAEVHFFYFSKTTENLEGSSWG